jgi:hypothetical protein
MHLLDRLAEGGPLVRLTVPVPPRLRRLLKRYIEWGGFTGWVRNARPILRSVRTATPVPRDIFLPGTGLTPGIGWLPLDTFRDQPFRRVAGFAEVILAPSGREGILQLQVEPGAPPGGPAVCARLVDADGRVLGELPANGPTSMEFSVGCTAGRTQVLRLDGQDSLGRTAELKIFRCDWTQPDATPATAEATQSPWGSGWRFDPATGARVSGGSSELMLLAQGRPLFVDLETDVHAAFEVRNSGGKTLARFPLDGRRVQRLDLDLEAGRTHVLELAASGPFRAYSCGVTEPSPLPTLSAPQPHQTAADFLHTNGCGDFTLMAREHWFDLRGYPEMDLFSMNLDSLFCFAAHYGGAREEVLSDPARIYHIEHGSGSGWTPEGQARLFERIAAKGLSFIGNDEILAMAAQMRRLGAPMIFNHEDWGLAAFELKETLVRASYRDLPA